MVHHRCTGCKRESYPRHKYGGGVFCDDCMSSIASHSYIKAPSRRRSWLGSLWDKIVDHARSFFRPLAPKPESSIESASYARLKSMEARARRIPSNPEAGVPQKR